MNKRTVYFSTLAFTFFLSVLLAVWLKTDRLYTHFFYIPIVLTAIWYSKYTVTVGAGFALLHFAIELVVKGSLGYTSIARGCIILLISYILGEIWKKEKAYLKQIHQLSYDSTHDFLTHIYNRGFFDTVLHGKTQLPMAIFICDIDKLKYINDHFGHAQGDYMIISTAQLLSKSIESNAVLARLGGDEFGIIIQDCDGSEAIKVYNNIESNVKQFNEASKVNLLLSLSIGYSICNSYENVVATFKEADDLMYQEKDAKKQVD